MPIITPNNVSLAMVADINVDLNKANIGARQEDLPFTRSTPYKELRFGGTAEKTILHYASEVKNLKVFCWGIPLVSQCVLPKGSMSCYDPLIKEQSPIPAPFVFLNGKTDYTKKEDYELIFHQHADSLCVLFATVRTLARNNDYDVIFIGVHETDIYAHWYDGDAKIRQIKFLGDEIRELSKIGPVFIWSDHGATLQRDDSPFFINKFLRDKGWLKYKIHEDIIEYNKKKWVDPKFPDTLPLGSPFVEIDWRKTKFFCADAFDSMVDCTYRACNKDRFKLMDQLMETRYYDSVKMKKDSFDKEGKYYKKTPDILPETSPGVSVSCNVHEKAEGGNNLCMMRRGWHSNRACSVLIGDELQTEIKCMRDVYTAMKEFIDKQKPEASQPIDESIIMEELAHDLMY